MPETSCPSLDDKIQELKRECPAQGTDFDWICKRDYTNLSDVICETVCTESCGSNRRRLKSLANAGEAKDRRIKAKDRRIKALSKENKHLTALLKKHGIALP